MKTTILFSASLFISAASFAQTSVQNQTAAKEITTVQSTPNSIQAKSQTNAGSTTTVQSNAVQHTENKAAASAEKGKTEIIAEKNQAEANGQAAAKQGKKTASQDISVSAGENANAQASAGSKDNKIKENASLNSQANLSAAADKATGNQAKEGVKASVKSSSNLAVEKGTQVKDQTGKTVIAADHAVKASSVKTVQTSSAAVHVVKPNPVKINGQVKAAGAVRIK